jgi:hypothetical protein
MKTKANGKTESAIIPGMRRKNPPRGTEPQS